MDKSPKLIPISGPDLVIATMGQCEPIGDGDGKVTTASMIAANVSLICSTVILLQQTLKSQGFTMTAEEIVQAGALYHFREPHFAHDAGLDFARLYVKNNEGKTPWVKVGVSPEAEELMRQEPEPETDKPD